MTEAEIQEKILKRLQRHTEYLFRKPIWGRNWYFEEQYLIRFGRDRRGYADITLLINGNPFMIVECKSPRRNPTEIKEGKEQLESYLNASRANLGIFANNDDPQKWTYYDNSIGFDEIDRSTFWGEIRAAFNIERDIEKEAQRIKLKRIEARVRELVTPKAIHEAAQARAVIMIEEEAKERVTEDAIQGAVTQQLETRASELVNANPEAIQERANKIIYERAYKRVTENAIQGAVAQQLQAKLDESRNKAMWGWILFGISVVLLIAVAANS